MANVTITDLTEQLSVNSNDVLPIVNVGANSTQKVTAETLKNFMGVSGNLTGNLDGNGFGASNLSFVNVSGNISATGRLVSAGALFTSTVNMNNASIVNINGLQIADAGRNEGIQWTDTNQWAIFDSPNDFTNVSGNLQFTTGNTANAANTAAYKRVTFNTLGQVEIPVATGTAPLSVNSTTLVANLNADLLDGFNSSQVNAANTVVVRTASGDIAVANILSAGNIIPSANGIYSLGNSTNYWSNLWVAGNTLYVGGVPIGVSGNTLTVNSTSVLTNGDNGNSISLLTVENLSYTTADWDTATWTNDGGNGNIAFTSVNPGLETTLEIFNAYINPRVIVNGTTTANIVSVAVGRSVSMVIDQLPPTDPTTVTSLEFVYEAGLVVDPAASFNGISFGGAAAANINVGGNVYSFNAQGGLTVPAGITVGNVRSPRIANATSFNSTDLTLETLAGGGVDGRGGNINLIAGGPAGNATQGGAILIGPINTSNIFIGGAPGYASQVTATFAGNITANGTISATGNITTPVVSTDIVESLDGNVALTLANNTLIAASNRDARITANGTFGIRNNSTTEPIQIITDYDNTALTWDFNADGSLDAPGNISASNVLLSGNITSIVSVTDPTDFDNLTPINGGRAFVTNANLAAAGNFGAQVSGGGSNTVPVWSDGANWYIG